MPEYLRLRYDEKTRGLNAMTFAVMTVFSIGISLYGLACCLKRCLAGNFRFRSRSSAVIVMVYTFHRRPHRAPFTTKSCSFS